jgi:hypothetical protein
MSVQRSVWFIYTHSSGDRINGFTLRYAAAIFYFGISIALIRSFYADSLSAVPMGSKLHSQLVSFIWAHVGMLALVLRTSSWYGWLFDSHRIPFSSIGLVKRRMFFRFMLQASESRRLLLGTHSFLLRVFGALRCQRLVCSALSGFPVAPLKFFCVH